MLVLGVSGTNDREHDPACCLYRDGKLIAMVEEERFVREKHAPGIAPYNAIKYCLELGKVSLDDIDYISLGWDYKINPYWQKTIDIFPILFPKNIFNYTKKPKVKFYQHHLAHAASSFLLSGFKESLIMVVDGQGELESISIGVGFTTKNGNKKIKFIKSYPIDLSLGYFYDQISEYIGLGHWSAGKTMGLAPYGNEIIKFPFQLLKNGNFKIKFLEKFEIGKGELDDEEQISSLWRQLLASKKMVIPKLTEEPKQILKDLAFSGQFYLESISYHILDFLKSKYPDIQNLCLSGGVALNCTNNSKLIDKFLFKDVFIQPAANDAGVVLGAAALVLNENGKTIEPLTNTYYGPEYSDVTIKIILDKNSITYKKYINISKKAANLLANNKVVGWFQGRMEFGPRALGNRSILASPFEKNMLDRVNKIKGREKWRPLSPIIAADKVSQYLDNSRDSKYMLQTFLVKKQYRKQLAAITHVDGSTRPQTVNKNDNLRLYNLLKEFEEITGFSILINTSFNTIKYEPIVNSPEDALRSFVKSDLDYLVIGNYLIKK